MTLATRSETNAIERALPEVAKSEDDEIRNGFFFMSNVLPLTAGINFHFEDDAIPELLYLRDFWECRQTMADDYVAIWELWCQTISPVVALEWWNTYDKRSSSLRADKIFQATPEELATDPN